jgi:site-specific DNA recombinase
MGALSAAILLNRMKVVGYLRVSTEEQAIGGVSLAAQREKVLAYCTLYDLALVEIIEDGGVSGKSLNRPGLRRALQLLESDQAEGLVVAKLDRLTRSVVDMANLVSKVFGDHGGKSLLSVADQVDTRSSAGRLVLNVLVSVSQWEREAIGERTRDALRHKRSRGQVFGPLPLGYTRSANGRELVPSPLEAVTVERAVRLHAGGCSLRRIAAILVEEGHKTKRGGAWHPATIRKLLQRSPIGKAA